MLHAANHIFHPTAGKVAIALAVLAWPLGARIGVEPAELRSLYLNVEKGGNLITGLTQANFRLYVNGKPHAFRLGTESTAQLRFHAGFARGLGHPI
jgi:hypothetical protein